MRLVLISLVSLLLSFGAVAEEHPIGKLTGPDIDLYSYDHAFAGKIKDFVAWGFVNEEIFTSFLTLRKDGQIINAQFKKQEDGRMGGSVSYQINGAIKAAEVYMSRVDFENRRIELLINGKLTLVNITADGFANGHFTNPTYSLELDGEMFDLSLEGQACFGLSFHYLAMVISAYTL